MILNLLAAIGFVLVLTRSSIADKLLKSRLPIEVAEFLDCPMCSGFWVGLIWGFIFGQNPIVMAFVISLLSFMTVTAADTLQSLVRLNEARIEWDADAAESLTEGRQSPGKQSQ